MIKVEAVWLAVEPLDMRAGTEAALARVVTVFGAARPHHAYLFANRRANRMKVLVHDGIGVWLAARRLNSGRFVWPKDVGGTLTLSRAQLDALVLSLPWQRIGDAGVITLPTQPASRIAELLPHHWTVNVVGLICTPTVKVGSPDAYPATDRWACPPAKARHGQRTACRHCSGCATSAPTSRPRAMVSG